ncbi:MAG: hypothetical protein KDD58_01405 [Bdellovibrionales bacterium]|nr:hypothetical protein [Bdellovibrionales bacterium]
MKMVVSCFVFLSFISFSLAEDLSKGTDAEVTVSKALSFNKWKNMQVIEAQNKVVRLSNLLLLLKSEKYTPENTLPQVAIENKQELSIPESQQIELINQTEVQLNAAVASLEFVKELTLKDYFSVYLRKFKNDNQALENFAIEIEKAEVVELLTTLINLNASDIKLENQSVDVVSTTSKSESEVLKRSPSKL